MARFALVPSPFVSALSWAPTARVLSDALAIDYGGVSAPQWYADAAHRIVAQIDGTPWIAVLHSGAGGFAPALASASSDLGGLIFVDAVLPYPGKSYLQTASNAFARRLKRLVTDGILPPWNTWFEPDPLPLLIPDAHLRETFVRDLPQIPFAFLEAISPATSDWNRLPVAYLQLSNAYAAEASEATRRGWIVRHMELHHLAMVSNPIVIAEMLTDLGDCLRL